MDIGFHGIDAREAIIHFPAALFAGTCGSAYSADNGKVPICATMTFAQYQEIQPMITRSPAPLGCTDGLITNAV